MSPEIVGVIGLALLLVLIFFRMWIGLAMATIGFLGYGYLLGFHSAFSVLAKVPYNTIAFYPMAPIPLFMLMGVVIANTRMGEDLYGTAHKWIGQFRGGLAMATVVACALFAAITGSSSASIVAMGKIAQPQMKKYNYSESLSTGCIACAGTLAILIPPSMGFIMYGIITENSVGFLFMAGFLPGLLLTLLFIITIVITTLLNPSAGPPGPKSSWKEKILSLKNTWHMVLLFLLVLGGIYGGIFTPTEAGAVGAFGALLITFAGRRLNRKLLINTMLETGLMTAMVMLLIIGAFIFMKFLAVSKIPFMLSGLVAGLPVSRLVIMIGIIIMYIILGMFLDVFSAVILTIPVIYPLILTLGYDPIWFGVLIVVVMEMGLVTPPIGMNVFLLSGVVDTPLYTIFRGIWPFVAAMVVLIALLIIFPQIALFLPSTMRY